MLPIVKFHIPGRSMGEFRLPYETYDTCILCYTYVYDSVFYFSIRVYLRAMVQLTWASKPSLSSSPFSATITPSLFHSRLKTYYSANRSHLHRFLIPPDMPSRISRNLFAYNDISGKIANDPWRHVHAGGPEIRYMHQRACVDRVRLLADCNIRFVAILGPATVLQEGRVKT